MYETKLVYESNIGINKQTHQTGRIFLSLWCQPNFAPVKIGCKTLNAFAWE